MINKLLKENEYLRKIISDSESYDNNLINSKTTGSALENKVNNLLSKKKLLKRKKSEVSIKSNHTKDNEFNEFCVIDSENHNNIINDFEEIDSLKNIGNLGNFNNFKNEFSDKKILSLHKTPKNSNKDNKLSNLNNSLENLNKTKSRNDNKNKLEKNSEIFNLNINNKNVDEGNFILDNNEINELQKQNKEENNKRINKVYYNEDINSDILTNIKEKINFYEEINENIFDCIKIKTSEIDNKSKEKNNNENLFLNISENNSKLEIKNINFDNFYNAINSNSSNMDNIDKTSESTDFTNGDSNTKNNEKNKNIKINLQEEKNADRFVDDNYIKEFKIENEEKYNFCYAEEEDKNQYLLLSTPREINKKINK